MFFFDLIQPSYLFTVIAKVCTFFHRMQTCKSEFFRYHDISHHYNSHPKIPNRNIFIYFFIKVFAETQVNFKLTKPYVRLSTRPYATTRHIKKENMLSKRKYCEMWLRFVAVRNVVMPKAVPEKEHPELISFRRSKVSDVWRVLHV